MALFLGLIALVWASASCTSAPPRFPLRAVVWRDADQQPFYPPPAEREPQPFTDAAHQLVLRPLSEAWELDAASRAINVNALDEVPDSSWFVNRIGRYRMSSEEVARGACATADLDAPYPWTITSGKPVSSRSPGFFVRAANGVRFVLKAQGEQAGDAVVAAMLHAAGYYVPCNRVVYLDPAGFAIAPDATAPREDGGDERITERHVGRFLRATPERDGFHRAMLSELVAGNPLGPWNYLGTREGDPNDVVPHEARRDLRGLHVLFAWVNHWDARQLNTLSTWHGADDGRGGYVRHYLLDFGEALGVMNPIHRLAQRDGHELFFDPGAIARDTLALGLLDHPWTGHQPHPLFGYFDVEHFEAGAWRPHYWNGAFEQRTEGDMAWAARLVARFDEAHLRAIVTRADYADPTAEPQLLQILRGRQRALLQRYLTGLSPLADPRTGASALGRAMLCTTDLAVASSLVSASTRSYDVRMASGGVLRSLPVSSCGAEVCTTLPEERGSGRAEDYRVVEFEITAEPGPHPGLARVHVYVTGPNQVQVVGLERPPPRVR